MLPITTLAATKDDYNSKDFLETLEDEGIEKAFDSYKPNDDAITIYMFRGKGCGYCRAFLEFMNKIAGEYGKYFVLESYEVWNDQNNNNLMTSISTFMGQPASGVPYIIIGDKVFPGFAEDYYGEDMKAAIKSLYETEKSDRYDAFEEYEKSQEKKDDSKSSSASDRNTLVWNFIFVAVGTAVVLAFVNTKMNNLKEDLTATIKKRK